MTNFLDTVSAEEKQQLIDAIPQITVLIAGADGEIEAKETEWAKKVTEIRTYKAPEILLNYYNEVGKVYAQRLDEWISRTEGGSTGDRIELLSEELAKLNTTMRKINPAACAHLYKSFLSFAKHVAKASGGVFGMLSIDTYEDDLMKLPMLDKDKILG